MTFGSAALPAVDLQWYPRHRPRIQELWTRTELYFGSDKHDGTVVTKAEFMQFHRQRGDSTISGRANSADRIRSVSRFGRHDRKGTVDGFDPVLSRPYLRRRQKNRGDSRLLQTLVPAGVGPAGG
jgi:hypothetical protein